MRFGVWVRLGLSLGGTQTKLNVKLKLMAHCLIMICYEGCIVMSEVDLTSCWIQRAELECSDRFIRQPKKGRLDFNLVQFPC